MRGLRKGCVPVLLALASCIAGCGRPGPGERAAASVRKKPIRGRPTKAFVLSLIKSKKSSLERRQVIRQVFAKEPSKLIGIIYGLNIEGDWSSDVERACVDGLADLLGKDDYERVLSAIRKAPNNRKRAALVEVISGNRGLLEAVRENPDAILTMLGGSSSQDTTFALSDALSYAKVKRAIPIIVSKLDHERLYKGRVRLHLDPALVRLEHQPTLAKCAKLLKSDNFREQNLAVLVFSRAASPETMKYLIPWLEIKKRPEVGASVDPPSRYCDFAVDFAKFFRSRPSDPRSRVRVCEPPGERGYSDEEIEDVKLWWETVKDTEEYR